MLRCVRFGLGTLRVVPFWLGDAPFGSVSAWGRSVSFRFGLGTPFWFVSAWGRSFCSVSALGCRQVSLL